MIDEPPTAAQRAEALRRHGLDPATPLASRVGKTPEKVFKMFEEARMAVPRPHALTDTERRSLAEALAVLPPLHRRILQERLRSLSFLDGMPNTALMSVVNFEEPYRLYDITIRAGVLHQDVSEWLTEKERTCFDAKGSPLSVSIEAGTRDAILFVLLHEGTHIVDNCLRITPAVRLDGQPVDAHLTPFTEAIWTGRTTAAPRYRDPLRERVRFYAGGQVLPIDKAEAVYASLSRTPFVSLYGSSNWYDDLAEYVAVYHLTEKLGQPFRIVLRKDGKEVFAHEPMKSDLVRGRIGQMRQFYDIHQ